MKKKLIISKLWLYRYRFVIGYVLLGIAFVALVFLLPLLAPNGLSEGEMKSSVASYNTHFSSVTTGELADLPYHALQKISILIFGLNTYSIKLPSILIGVVLGFLLILLLNRWFKSNVALIASILAVLSTPFLYLAGSGTPLIMTVFWPTLLLWLGSKIQGKTHPQPIYCFLFVFALILSIFTPHLIYLALFIAIFIAINPHLRFTIKNLPKIPLITSAIITLLGFGAFVFELVIHPDLANKIFLAEGFAWANFFTNFKSAAGSLFGWGGGASDIFLKPLFNIALIALAIVGLSSTRKGFLASRNAIASCFVVFSLVMAGFSADLIIMLLLPIAILVAHGVRYVLEKWYNLFPENPYARVFAILPISILLGLILVSDATHYVFGYRYSPEAASHFSTDLELVKENLKEGDQLLISEAGVQRDFYNILAKRAGFEVVSKVSSIAPGRIAVLGKKENMEAFGELSQIITSPKSEKSDRIYLYTKKEKNNGSN